MEGGKVEPVKKVLCEPWYATVRKMENGDVALPFSVAFVMKKFENFDSQNCRVDVKMTLILRVKCHGLDRMTSADHMKEVMDHIATK